MSAQSDNSILQEVRRLHDNEQSGTLTLVNGGGSQIEVSFREGLIEAVSSNLDARRLGDYLVREGYLDSRELEAAKTEAQKEKIFLGEAVVRRRLLSRAEVGETVRVQAIDLLEYAVKNAFVVKAFASSLRSYYAPARISFPHVLLQLSRNDDEPFEVSSQARMILSDQVDLSAFPWHPHEVSVLNDLRSPSTFEGLLKSTGLRDSTLRQTLGILDRLGVLRFVDTSDAVQPTEPVPSLGSLVKQSDFPFEHLIPSVTNAVLNEKLEVARNEFSFTSEQFKNLKVQISETNSTHPLKVITVSSPDSQDGKSLISANLALSFAKDPERRVIVVDCDLRSPSLGHYLGVTNEPGLLQYLSDGHLSPYCYVRRIGNLYFLTTGGVSPNPIEIFSMNKVRQLIESLRSHFDTVILDAPPYCPIADARVVTSLSDGLILVVRRGKTSYSSIDRAFKSIDRNKLIGVVFNDVQPMLFHTYHNFGYYGNQGQVYPVNRRSGSGPKNYLRA
jgi:capsular exopolysaccharide synthesis family protein